jgi:hypothetical protein
MPTRVQSTSRRQNLEETTSPTREKEQVEVIKRIEEDLTSREAENLFAPQRCAATSMATINSNLEWAVSRHTNFSTGTTCDSGLPPSQSHTVRHMCDQVALRRTQTSQSAASVPPMERTADRAT